MTPAEGEGINVYPMGSEKELTIPQFGDEPQGRRTPLGHGLLAAHFSQNV